MSIWTDASAKDCAATEPVVDTDALNGLRELQGEGEPDLLKELVDLFEEDTESRLTSLQEAIREVNAPVIEREAHALKGSCSNFGARPMAAICSQLESVSRAGDLSGVPTLVRQLIIEYGRVRVALSAELATA